jgi:hypothetical protein
MRLQDTAVPYHCEMDRRGTDSYRQALARALRPLEEAELRFFNLGVRFGDENGSRLACHELARAAGSAESWLVANPCPDAEINQHLRAQIQTCRTISRLVSSNKSSADEQLKERLEFRLDDLQHKLLWNRDAIAAWVAT